MNTPATVARAIAVVLLLASAPGAPIAAETAAAPPPDVPAAVRLVNEAAVATDPATGRDLARRAIPALLEAAVGTSDCALLATLAEAQLRAGLAADAIATIGRTPQPPCEPAAFTHLAAWAREFAPDGSRRGPGADLPQARELYFRAASQYGQRADSADLHEETALALISGAEIALQLGDATAAREAGLRALRLARDTALATRAGVLVLAAAGPELGEGSATNLVAEITGDRRELLRDILDARNRQVGAELEIRPGDPNLLAAAGFYSLFAGGDVGLALARHHLERAAATGFPLVELNYLRGRLARDMGDRARAADLFRAQVREYPDAAASPLAANDLCWMIAEDGAPVAEMESALALLDGQIGRAPREAALHETRSRLLERLGRHAEALAAAERAAALEPSAERSAAVTRLRGGG